MNDSRLTKYMYEYDYQLCKNNWCSELKDIFTQLDMNTFYEHKVINLFAILHLSNENYLNG